MLNSALAAAAGIAGWSASEYLIHRYLGHEWAKRRNAFSVEHVRHHATTSYFAASWKKAAAAAASAAIVGPLASAAVGRRRGVAFTAGYVAMYVSYEVLHRRAHTHPPTGHYSRWLRKHHFHHHFMSPKMNHGVTSPLWDHVFGTHQAPGPIRVPARHAMQWLLDEDGQVAEAYRDDYVLVTKGKPPGAQPSSSGERDATDPTSSTPGSPHPGSERRPIAAA
jgi:Fatty acid hydroxylase